MQHSVFLFSKFLLYDWNFTYVNNYHGISAMIKYVILYFIPGKNRARTHLCI